MDRSPVDEAALELTDHERASLSPNPMTRRAQLICYREARRSLVVEPDPVEVERVESEAMAARMAERWASFVPPRYLDATLDRVTGRHGDDLPRALDEWERSVPRPNLVLVGPLGVGKTFAALAAVRRAVERNERVVYWSAGRLLQELRPGRDGAEILVGLLDADILILDDLGVEKASEWTTEQLSIVVGERYDHLRPIVVTTNDLGSLASSTRERGKSRLLDGALVLAVGGTRLR